MNDHTVTQPPKTTHQAGFRVWLGLAEVAVLSWLGLNALADERLWLGGLLLGSASLVMIGLSPSLPPLPAWSGQPVTDPGLVTRSRRRTAGIVCFGLAAILLGLAAWQFVPHIGPRKAPGSLPWVLYGSGVALWITGGVLLTRARARRRPTLRVVILLLLVTGLAAALRLVRLDGVPYGVWVDEAFNGLQARDMLHDGSYRPIFVFNITGPHLALYALALRLAGETSVYGLRLVSAGFGIGTVLAGFAVGNQLRGPWFGGLMAFFLAVMSWAINFSRFALTGIETGLFTLLAFYFVVRLVRYGRLRDALWTGVSIGAGLWFYSAFRALLIPLVLYGLVMWRARRPVPLLRVGSIVAITALVVILPLALFAVRDSDTFFSRTRQVWIQACKEDYQSTTDALAENIERHLLMFHVAGDPNGRHNLSKAPMLDPIMGGLLVLGLAVGLSRARCAETGFFGLVLVVGLLGGILTCTFEAPQALRTIGVLPAIAYFCALAVWAGGKALETEAGGRLSVAVVSLALLAGVTHQNVTRYFVDQANDERSWREFFGGETCLALAAREHVNTYQIAYSSLAVNDLILRFVAPGVTSRQQILEYDAWPLRFPVQKPVMVFVHEAQANLLQQAEVFYPDAVITPVTISDCDDVQLDRDPPMFYTLVLGIDAINRLQGLSGGREGVLYAPLYGDYRFWTVPASALTINGQRVLQGVPIRLAEGNHAISIAPGGAALEWYTPNSHQRETVPEWMVFHDPVTVNGLYAYFYPNDQWDGEPALERIDPQLDAYYHWLPLKNPFTVRWAGWLTIPDDGDYRLSMRAVTSVELWLDSKLVLRTVQPGKTIDTPEPVAPGRYAVEVRYLSQLGGSRLHLLWSVDGGDFVPIPGQALTPD
ncbi:MAG: glycosyltransferase family 39 protein [Anaerolineae bacterium]|nr:glycosyltransferase family 39 protein [Anaerolineae bacterium]